MSSVEVEVSSTQLGNPALVAGNTADSLTAVNAVEQAQVTSSNGLPSAADLDHIAEELHALAATQGSVVVNTAAEPLVPTLPTPAPTPTPTPTPTDFVTRAELDVVASALGELVERITLFNSRSGQKI